jgi:TonB-linked SusC/RagA family outer membrane protein
MNAAVGEVTGPSNPEFTYATQGYFGRFSYNFDEKYLFEFNGRYDGTSKFGENDRFGFFPSFAVGYNIHKENFWAPLENVINTFKVRASYGTLGNQNVVKDGSDLHGYWHLPNIAINSDLAYIIGGERPNYANMPAIVSGGLTWETSKTQNLGVDFSLLRNRLSSTVEVFKRTTENMFGPIAALPATLGTSPPDANSATLETKGFEIILGWKDRINDFSYNVNFILSDSKSFITDYHNPDNVLSSHYVGKELGEIWGYETEGIFQTQEEVDNRIVDQSYIGGSLAPGDIMYMDLNGDNLVNKGDNTLENPGDQKIIGNSRNRFTYSASAGASYKNFDFNMVWQGVGKKDVWIGSGNSIFWGWAKKAHSIVLEEHLNYWSEDNTDAYYPRVLDNSGKNGHTKNQQAQTRYLQNGAYVRLKNIQLGYTLPRSLTEKLRLQKLRFYVSGENLFTSTKMFNAVDPEVIGASGSSKIYPMSKVYSAGLNVTF